MHPKRSDTRRHASHTTRLVAVGIAALVVGALGVSTPASAAKSLPEVTVEGLKLIPKTQVSALYLREGVDFGAFDKVAILDCHVAFKKNWQRDHNRSTGFRVSDTDVARIKTSLATEFKEVFTKQLIAKGETIATAAGTGVLILRPAIINLEVTAPDTKEAARTRTFSATTGQATLYLELYDSVTGELLARAVDVEEVGDTGFIGVRNGTTNRSDARRMLTKWAEQLSSFLQNARASTMLAPK